MAFRMIRSIRFEKKHVCSMFVNVERSDQREGRRYAPQHHSNIEQTFSLPTDCTDYTDFHVPLELPSRRCLTCETYLCNLCHLWEKNHQHYPSYPLSIRVHENLVL